MLSILYYIWLAAICTVVLVLSVAVLALTYPFQKSRRIVHEMSRYLALSFLLPFPRRVEGLETSTAASVTSSYSTTSHGRYRRALPCAAQFPLGFQTRSLPHPLLRAVPARPRRHLHRQGTCRRGVGAAAPRRRAVVVARSFGGDLSGGHAFARRRNLSFQGGGLSRWRAKRASKFCLWCSTVRPR